jgi:hypothetical protein
MFICLLGLSELHKRILKNQLTSLLSENLPRSVEQNIHDVHMHMPQHQWLASSGDWYLPDSQPYDLCRKSADHQE